MINFLLCFSLVCFLFNFFYILFFTFFLYYINLSILFVDTRFLIRFYSINIFSSFESYFRISSLRAICWLLYHFLFFYVKQVNTKHVLLLNLYYSCNLLIFSRCFAFLSINMNDFFQPSIIPFFINFPSFRLIVAVFFRLLLWINLLKNLFWFLLRIFVGIAL